MKILIAEDDKITRSLLTRWVARWGYEPIVVDNGLQAIEALRADHQIQLCVMDWIMPELSGPEVCQKLRQERDEPYVYITLLTSKTETDDVVEGLKSGADDYIHKPCHPLELEVRLRVGRRLVELQSKLIETREKLRFQASHDGLTQLYNRSATVEELARRIVSGREANRPVALLMADVDHFKEINDTYGHSAGDTVLREVATRFSGHLRPGDFAGRIGGEEFLLVLDDCNLEYGKDLAEAVRKSLCDVPVSVGPLSIPVSASFGLASTSQTTRADVELLTRAADAAMYRAKRAGRNRVHSAEVREFDRPSLLPSRRFPTSAA